LAAEVAAEDASTYLDLYKLAVEMADRVSARRTQANAFFLTLQSALVALLGNESFDNYAIAAAGIVLGAAWWLLLRSYRELNQAKFEVIVEMEAMLPVQIFGDEWKSLKRNSIPVWRQRYAELGTVERIVPLICMLGYLAVLLVTWL
jgi:hypothetical protein